MAEDFQTRIEIVSAARSRFRRFGYAKTAMQEIAEDCGMSAANIYRHYENKQAIAAVVVEADLARLYEACHGAIAAAGPHLLPQLTALFEAIIDTTRRQIKQTPLLFELGMAVTREMPALRLRVLGEVREMLRVIVHSARARGEIREGDATHDADLILLAGAPFVLPWLLRNQPFGDPRGKVAPLMACLVAGLAAPQILVTH
ncbi:MAG: TetR/AcrR family transcriptional regulator [Opitutaceae bacterium]